MVKCAECGFLGVRHPLTQTLIGPSEHQRQTGVPTTDSIPIVGRMDEYAPGEAIPDTRPVCAIGAIQIGNEHCGGNDNRVKCHSAQAVMQKDRTCGEFTKWIPGLSPKEHIDMLTAQTDRLWQERQTERDRQWRKEDNRRMAWWGVAGTVLGIVLTTFAQTLTNRSSPPPSLPPQSTIQQSDAPAAPAEPA